jgi:hypothetical protein
MLTPIVCARQRATRRVPGAPRGACANPAPPRPMRSPLNVLRRELVTVLAMGAGLPRQPATGVTNPGAHQGFRHRRQLAHATIIATFHRSISARRRANRAPGRRSPRRRRPSTAHDAPGCTPCSVWRPSAAAPDGQACPVCCRDRGRPANHRRGGWPTAPVRGPNPPGRSLSGAPSHCTRARIQSSCAQTRSLDEMIASAASRAEDGCSRCRCRIGYYRGGSIPLEVRHTRNSTSSSGGTPARAQLHHRVTGGNRRRRGLSGHNGLQPLAQVSGAADLPQQKRLVRVQIPPLDHRAPQSATLRTQPTRNRRWLGHTRIIPPARDITSTPPPAPARTSTDLAGEQTAVPGAVGLDRVVHEKRDHARSHCGGVQVCRKPRH